MKNFIKLFWKQISLISVILVLVLCVILDKSCQSKPGQQAATVTETQWKQNYIDSLATIWANEKILIQDSLIRLHTKELANTQAGTAKLKTQNSKLTVENDTLRKFYAANHTLQVCDSVVKGQDKQISGLNTELDSCYSEAESYSRLYYLENQKYDIASGLVATKQQSLDVANQSIEKLLKSNKRTWWERNEKWVFLIGGVVGTYLIVK